MSEALVPEMVSAQPPAVPADEAREADKELNQLLTRFMDCAAMVAKAIHKIRSQELYRPLGFETFEAYLRGKELRFSRSFVYQLAKVGEVMENAGVDPQDNNALQGLQISKLAQIARLTSPDEQRQILTTGKFEVARADGTRVEQPLNEIPLKVLSAELDDRLGIQRPERKRSDERPGSQEMSVAEAALARTAIFGTKETSDPAAGSEVWSDFGSTPMAPDAWRAALNELVFQLQGLEFADRQTAIQETQSMLAAMLSEIPF